LKVFILTLKQIMSLAILPATDVVCIGPMLTLPLPPEVAMLA
jgi:hypothetical protein